MSRRASRDPTTPGDLFYSRGRVTVLESLSEDEPLSSTAVPALPLGGYACVPCSLQACGHGKGADPISAEARWPEPMIQGRFLNDGSARDRLERVGRLIGNVVGMGVLMALARVVLRDLV